MAIYSGFSHWKWWFSIVMWLFTRGYGMFLGQPHCFRLGVIRSPSATKVQPGKPRGDDRNLGHMAKKFQQKIPSHPGGVDLYFADFPGFPTIQIYQNDHENDNFYQLLSANPWDLRTFHGFPWLSMAFLPRLSQFLLRRGTFAPLLVSCPEGSIVQCMASIPPGVMVWQV